MFEKTSRTDGHEHFVSTSLLLGPIRNVKPNKIDSRQHLCADYGLLMDDLNYNSFLLPLSQTQKYRKNPKVKLQKNGCA